MRLMSLTLGIALAAPLTAMDEEPTVTLILNPNNVGIQQSLQIDDRGRTRHSSGMLTILVSAIPAPASVAVTGYSRLTITEAVTDNGEILKHGQHDHGFTRVDRRRHDHSRKGFTTHIQLPPPSKRANRVATLKGTIDLALATGKPKSAEIKPIKDFIGKRLQIEGVEGAEITISEFSDTQIEITMPKATDQRLDDVSFTDSAGVTCKVNGSGSGHDNDLYRRSFHVAVPADGAMLLQFHSDVRTVTVPFAMTDIPLPGGTETTKPADAVIKTKEMPDKTDPKPELKVKAEGDF